MRLRAKTSTAVHTPKGLVFVRGPELSDDGDNDSGEIVEVADDFVVNPDVWDIVQPPSGKQKPVLAKTLAERLAEMEARTIQKALGGSAD